MTFELSAPYAPVSNALDILKQIRERGLPNPVTSQVLERVGIPPGNVPRSIVLLKFLSLIDNDGNLTEKHERLKRARSDEYQNILADIIRESYRDVFDYVDPATDDPDAITDAFRHYEPAAQRSRMVNLFIGLCEEAGIRQPVKRTPPRSTSPRSGTSRTRKTRSQSRNTGDNKSNSSEEHHSNKVENDGTQFETILEELRQLKTEITLLRQDHLDFDTDYALIIALLHQLPPDKRWSKQQRERWLNVFTTNLEYLIDIENINEEDEEFGDD